MFLNVNNIIARVEHGNIPEHEDSPMTWENIQVFLGNQEFLNGPNKKYLEKGDSYRLLQTTCAKYGPYS